MSERTQSFLLYGGLLVVIVVLVTIAINNNGGLNPEAIPDGSTVEEISETDVSSGTIVATEDIGDVDYTDGTYSTSSEYISPAGPETITVELTVVNNQVTEVKVTPQAQNATSQIYQQQFVDGVAAEVVNKDLSDIQLSKINGSSLTPNGFNAALARIRSLASSST